MNRRMINLIAIFVILVGGIYLSQPEDAKAMYSPCCFWDEAECTECQWICDGSECREQCIDGGENNWEVKGVTTDPPVCP